MAVPADVFSLLHDSEFVDAHELLVITFIGSCNYMQELALQLCTHVSEFILLLFKRGQTSESISSVLATS